MKIQDCIDAGTEYCPCYLAETGECIMCSQLQGKVFCDCINWKGVCIYQEYIWNHSRNKDNRQGEYCRILAKNNVPPTVTLLKIEVPKTLARELNQPGAYVFLRTAQDTAYFDMPISVMRADERAGTIEVAIQEKGIKTKYLRLGEAVDTADTADTADTVESAELAEAAGKSEQGIFLRGPYWNGVLGLKYLKSFQKGKALMIVRGIGQAPALAVAKKLLQGGNEVEVVLDEGWIKADLTMKLFQELGCSVLKKEALDLAKLTLTEEISAYIKESLLHQGVELIYSGGSELLHQGIARIIQEVRPEVSLVCSNNAQICCGEGICGSCQTRLADGSRVRRCKSQLDPIEIFGGR